MTTELPLPDPGNDATAVADAAGKASPPDASLLEGQVRQATLELLKHGLLEHATKPNLYQVAVTWRERINGVLANLDLCVRLDDIRGLAYVAVVRDGEDVAEDWSHPLVRRQRLTLEQSLLVAILRQQFIAHEVEAGVGAADARVDIDDLTPHLQAYLGFLGSDQQERRRTVGLLEQLKGHGIVSDIDQQERVTIRPIIAHLANPENLGNLLQELRAAADGGRASDVDAANVTEDEYVQ